MNSVQEAKYYTIQAMSQRLADLISTQELYPDGLGDLLPEICSTSYSQYGLDVHIPYNMEYLKTIDTFLVKDGWKKEVEEFNQSSGNFHTKYSKESNRTNQYGWSPYLYIDIYLNPTLDGSVCELVEVSSEEITYTRKTYEAVCHDGAKETTGMVSS